jgi:acyl-CoA-binding protein
MDTVAQMLNEQNIPTREGGRFDAKAVERILTHSAMKGEWNHHGITESCPVITDPTTWDRAQKLINELKGSPKARRSVYLFFKYATCGICGELMKGKRKGSTHHSRQYSCKGKSNPQKQHSHIHILEEVLEEKWLEGIKIAGGSRKVRRFANCE